MKKELLVSLSDIEAVCIECSNPACKSQMRFPIKQEAKFSDVQGVISPLEQCVACGTTFDTKARLISILGAIKQLGKDMRLQINADGLS